MEASLPTDGSSGGGDALRAGLQAELPRLRALLRRLGGADADDLVQEVAVRALRYRTSFDGRRAAWPWLRTVALRVWIDHRRLSDAAPLALEEGEVGAARADDALEERELVARLLSRLSEVECTVLVRFHRDGEGVRRIALALGMPEGTVKSHLHRARRKLAGRGPEEER